MKKGSLFKKIIYSSLFLATIPSAIFVLLIPPNGNKYLIETRQEIQDERVTYMDLDADTISERISFSTSSPNHFVTVKDHKLRWHDQWPFKDSLDWTISGPFFGDYDSDNYMEIYVFSYKRDSLFLSLYEILDPEGKRLDRIYVDKCGYQNGHIYAWISSGGFHDKNGDGVKEFYFSVSSGGRIGPRKLYSFDIENKTFDSSIRLSTVIINPRIVDIDNDQKPEIIGTTSASGNYMRNALYTDSSAWFMVFNETLEFDIPPVEFPGFAAGVETYPFNGNYLLLYSNNGTDPRAGKSRLTICTPGGKVVKERILSELGINAINLNAFIFEKTGKIIVAGEVLIAVDSNLTRTGITDSPVRFDNFHPRLIDMNHDGTGEIVLYSRDYRKIFVYNDNLELLCDRELMTESLGWNVSSYHQENGNAEVFIQSGETGYYMTMRPNRMYYIGFITHPAVYLLFLLFIVLVRKINTLQVVQREELKKRLLTLQLKGIKAQLDPHFTFNTFNSVASLIYLNDKQAAYDNMNKFSHLIRKMFSDAESIYRKIGEEIDFVNTYLELEKLRFGDKFTYIIETGEGVSNDELVPKLVLHTFAENAVKHGIMPLEKPGFLRIRIDREKEYLRIIVEDNGIGRENSKGITRSTGMGLKLTTEFYDILNQLNNKPVTFAIKDKHDAEGKPLGTLVEIIVPLLFSGENAL